MEAAPGVGYERERVFGPFGAELWAKDFAVYGGLRGSGEGFDVWRRQCAVLGLVGSGVDDLQTYVRRIRRAMPMIKLIT